MFASNTSQVSNGAVYVEDVFQTWLSTGNGTSRTVTGPDMTLGGLSITKSRSAATGWRWVDTARGAGLSLESNSTSAQATESTGVTAFTTTGTSIGSYADYNTNGATYVDYLLKKQPKFFDVVTYTGDGVAGRQISHALGSVPGTIIVKNTSSAIGWAVYHRSLGNAQSLQLNSTAAVSASVWWNSTDPTATNFTVANNIFTNTAGQTYVAYIFAHNAGGFGLTGTDNVISCGSFTPDGSGNATVTLGYEPQWLLYKRSDSTGNWWISDQMRGFGYSGTTVLYPNLSNAEALNFSTNGLVPTATGFQVNGQLTAGATYIYIAIRRGPMKVPTDGTSVFSPQTASISGGALQTIGFRSDLSISKTRDTADSNIWEDRLRGFSNANSTGVSRQLFSNSINAESTGGFAAVWQVWNTTFRQGDNPAGSPLNVWWEFQRAPGFFDEICFSGSGANKTEAHNLGKAPELWLVKSRSGATQWVFGSSLLAANEKIVMPSPNGRVTDATVWNSTYPTASVLSLGTSSTTNASGQTFVGYMWATVAGVSKVGMYTGNGSSQTINCGFTGGARFVMIIRATASTAQDIYIWDSARGIVAGNDPRLSLNTTGAEVTSLDTIDTAASGFVVNTDASNVNVNGAVYLYLSIA